MEVKLIKNNINIEKRYLKEDELYNISNLDFEDLKFIHLNKGETEITVNNNSINIVKNIISNNLINNRKILILCDDDEDVLNIYTSLHNSNIDSVIPYNTKFTKENLKMNLISKLDNLSQNTGQTLLSKINLLSKNIDKKIFILNNIKNSLTKIRECGLSLLQMYAITEKNISKYDDRNRYYKTYKLKEPFTKYNYFQIKESISKLKDNEILNKYIKYRRFINNTLFSKLQDGVSETKINKAIEKINYFLENPKELLLKDNEFKYLTEIKELLMISSDVSEETIATLSQIINLKYNSQILNIDDKKKTNKLFNWYRKKVNKERERKSKEKFHNLEKDIYVQITENIKDLKTFLEQFNFLKDIISTTEYENLIKKLLDGEKVFDYLDSLKNTLINVFLFNQLKNYFDNINNDHIEILKYCYDNVENKKDILKLLNSIPHIFLILKIEEIELKEKNDINSYQDFEIMLSEIHKEINCKISLIPKSIECILNNNINNKITDINHRYEEFLQDINKTQESDLYFLNTYYDLLLEVFPCVIIQRKNAEYLSKSFINSFQQVVEFHKPDGIINNNNKMILNSNNEIIDKTNAKFILDNFFKNQLYKQLSKLGYDINVDGYLGGYTFPIIINSKDKKKPLIAIELDYYIYYTDDYSVRENDICRRYDIENAENIYIIRLWTKDWWHNRIREVSKIQQIIKTAYENIN